MKNISCLICGGKDLSNLGRYGKGNHVFNIFQCNYCNLYFQNPLPSKNFLKRFYKDIYEKKYNLPCAQKAFEKRDVNQEKGRIREIENFAKKGKLLDIGASTGFFMEEARSSGWEVYGIEYSHKAVSEARSLGLDIQQGDVEIIDKFPNNYFDVITMHSVLDHLRSPEEVIKKIHGKLKKKGLFVFNVANIDSFEFFLFKVLKKEFPGFIIEHLYYFTPGLITKLIQRNNFIVLRITSRHHSSLSLPPKKPLAGWITFIPKLFLEYTNVGGKLKLGNVIYVYAMKK